MSENAAELSSMKTEDWPSIFVGRSHGRFEKNCSRTFKGKKLERRLVTDIFSATEYLPTTYHKLSLDHFAGEYMNLTNYFKFYFAVHVAYQKLLTYLHFS